MFLFAFLEAFYRHHLKPYLRLQGPKHLDLHGRPSSVPLHQRAADGGVQHCCTGDENEFFLEVKLYKIWKESF